MATEIEKYRIPLFDGTNFSNWKFRMETLLEELELLQFVQENYLTRVEFVDGETDTQRAAKEARLAELAKQDRKCANIFLTGGGNHLKLGDFGSAVKIKAHTTMPGELQGFVGTQAYMAPEVFMKTDTEGHGRAADIWSLGCVVVEMASGKRPWPEYDSNYQIMFKVGMGETPSAPPTLSEEGHKFVDRCLQHDPRKRATAKELLYHTFVRVDLDEEYLSSTLPSMFKDYLKINPRIL